MKPAHTTHSRSRRLVLFHSLTDATGTAAGSFSFVATHFSLVGSVFLFVDVVVVVFYVTWCVNGSFLAGSRMPSRREK